MTQDEIIEMARQAVADRHEKEFGVWWSWEEIETFAKLVAARYEQKIQDLEDMITELQERQE
jgi:predicted esterase